jgi:hypothetical protein
MKPYFKFVLISASMWISIWNPLHGQTETDGLWMPKRNFCGGLIAGASSWTHYWEGTLYRNNQNIGTLSSSFLMAMGNYGVGENTNIIFSLPYISNKASAGTLAPQQGLQDLNLSVKQYLGGRNWKGSTVGLTAVGGVSTPLSNYVADFLPLAIGVRSRTLSLRILGDLQRGNFFATASVAYVRRASIEIDRTAYYTTEMVYSNQVIMPDVFTWMVRTGYRKDPDHIVEFFADRMNTLGGFDMRRNDMPFPSNNMEQTRIGLGAKWALGKQGLSFMGNVSRVVAGRNMGQASAAMAGLVWQFAVPMKTKSIN